MRPRRTLSFVALFLAISAVACTDTATQPGETPATTKAPLTAEQCTFFAGDGDITVCHRTRSSRKQYVVVRTNSVLCGRHETHEGDYIGFNDPTCSGEGCFPAGAPYDGSVECCDGLTPQNGRCERVGCPAHANGAPDCVCDPGFVGTLTWEFELQAWTGACVDADECSAGTDDCSAHASCANTEGGFTCACDEGYAGDGVTCVDIDECETGLAGCSENASCTNTAGGFTCACDAGFVGDGTSCTDVDECTSGTHDCSADASCTNTAGGFTCACDEGYAGDGVTCVDIDECETGLAGCSENASCTNTAGGFTCVCDTGFSGDGVTCDDVDECGIGSSVCGPNASCANTFGSFACSCEPGYYNDGLEGAFACVQYPSPALPLPGMPMPSPPPPNSVFCDYYHCYFYEASQSPRWGALPQNSYVPGVSPEAALPSDLQSPPAPATPGIAWPYYCDSFYCYERCLSGYWRAADRFGAPNPFATECPILDVCGVDSGLCGENQVCTNILDGFLCSCEPGHYDEGGPGGAMSCVPYPEPALPPPGAPVPVPPPHDALVCDYFYCYFYDGSQSPPWSAEPRDPNPDEDIPAPNPPGEYLAPPESLLLQNIYCDYFYCYERCVSGYWRYFARSESTVPSMPECSDE